MAQIWVNEIITLSPSDKCFPVSIHVNCFKLYKLQLKKLSLKYGFYHHHIRKNSGKMVAFKLLVVFTLVALTSGQCCMDYWTSFNGKCYRYYNLLKTWYDAELYCINMGGHLVGINDRAENDFVNFLTSGPQNDDIWGHVVWIGFTDMFEEGDWNHVDESFYGFHNWAHGEPNNHNDEDCGETNFGGRGLWNDEQCTVHRRFVCEQWWTYNTKVEI